MSPANPHPSIRTSLRSVLLRMLTTLQKREVVLWEITKVKIEYDPVRDLLYLWFSTPGEKAADTVTVAPGLHADFDAGGKLIGIEVLDASEILGDKVQFEVDLLKSRAKQTILTG